jgi:hypothetical protein
MGHYLQVFVRHSIFYFLLKKLLTGTINLKEEIFLAIFNSPFLLETDSSSLLPHFVVEYRELSIAIVRYI